ncbi:Uncharacterised protein [uncultured archaeon]|nr:Uncharacterised protein [uncultured archaeon]
MSNTIIRSVSFEKKLFEQIEKKRGLIPRSTFINNLFRRIVEDETRIVHNCQALPAQPHPATNLR